MKPFPSTLFVCVAKFEWWQEEATRTGGESERRANHRGRRSATGYKRTLVDTQLWEREVRRAGPVRVAMF